MYLYAQQILNLFQILLCFPGFFRNYVYLIIFEVAFIYLFVITSLNIYLFVITSLNIYLFVITSLNIYLFVITSLNIYLFVIIILLFNSLSFDNSINAEIPPSFQFLVIET